MTKLFRNIRKNLLNEGETTKYFKYAIGEIVLMLSGILKTKNVALVHSTNPTFFSCARKGGFFCNYE